MVYITKLFPVGSGVVTSIQERLEHKAYHKGIQKGKLEEKLAIAENMLQEGVEIGFIKKVTGLTDRELSNLIH